MPRVATLWASLLTASLVAVVAWGLRTSAPPPSDVPPPPQQPQPPAPPRPAPPPLDDPDPDGRRRAWRALGESGDVHSLLARLARAGSAERLAACEGLAAARPGEAGAALPLLVGLLRERPEEAELRRSLRVVAEAAPAAFVRALPERPGRALDALVAAAPERIAGLAPPDRAALWARLTGWWLAGATSPTPGGEESLALLLVGLGSTDAAVLGPLRAAFEAGEPDASGRAALLLARMPSERASLLAAVGSPHERRRRAALVGLARAPGFPTGEERPRLLEALEDRSHAVREQAVVTLLGDGTDPEARLQGLSPEQRRSVSTILGALLRRPERGLRRLAARIVSVGQPTPETVSALGMALLSPDRDLRALAANALSSIPSENAPAAPAVVAALEGLDPKDDARAPVLWNLLVRMGAFAREALPRVLALYERADVQRRPQILAVLARLDPPIEAVLPTLRAALAETDDGVQLAVANCVSALGERAALLAPALLARLAALTPGRKPQADQLAPILATWGARSRRVRADALERVRRSDGTSRAAILDALAVLAKLEPLWAESLASLLDTHDAELRDEVMPRLVTAGRSVGAASGEFAAALEGLPLARIEASLGPLLRDPRESVSAAPVLLRLWSAHPESLPLRSAVRTVCALTPGAVAEALPGAPAEAKAVLRELLADASFQGATDAGVVEVVARELARWMDEGEVPTAALPSVVEFLARDAVRPEGPRHLPSVKALVDALARLEPGRSRALVVLLGGHGRAALGALGALRSLFEQTDVAVRVAVLDAVRQIDPEPADRRAFAAAGLADENHRVRGAALALATPLGAGLEPLARDLLLALGQAVRTDGPGDERRSPTTRRSQLRVLFRNPSEATLAAALAQLEDADPASRSLLFPAWGVLAADDPAWRGRLLDLLLDPDADLRGRSLAVLRELRADLRPQLGAIVGDPAAAAPAHVEELLALLAHLRGAVPEALPFLLRLHRASPGSAAVQRALLAVGPTAPQVVVAFLEPAAPPERTTLLRVLAASPLGALVPEHRATTSRWIVTALTEGALDAAGTDAALEVLGVLGGEPELLVPAVLGLLARPGAPAPQLVATALRLVPKASDAVAARLRAAGSEERGRLIPVLGIVAGALGAGDVAALGSALGDPSPAVRNAAGELLLRGPWGSADVVASTPGPVREGLGALMREWLRSAEPRRRTWALEVLLRMDARGPETVPLLLALWDEAPPPEVLGLLPSVLTRQMRPEDEASVLAHARERLASPSSAARALAVDVIAIAGGAASVPREAVLGLFADPTPGVRASAVRWTAKLGKDAADLEPRLLAALRDADASVVQFAAYALTQVAPTSAGHLAALEALAADAEAPLRWVGVNGLAAFGARAVRVLATLIEDAVVGDLAVGALGRIGPDARDTLPALEARLRRRPKDFALEQAIAAIRGRAPR